MESVQSQSAKLDLRTRISPTLCMRIEKMEDTALRIVIVVQIEAGHLLMTKVSRLLCVVVLSLTLLSETYPQKSRNVAAGLSNVVRASCCT